MAVAIDSLPVSSYHAKCRILLLMLLATWGYYRNGSGQYSCSSSLLPYYLWWRRMYRKSLEHCNIKLANILAEISIVWLYSGYYSLVYNFHYFHCRVSTMTISQQQIYILHGNLWEKSQLLNLLQNKYAQLRKIVNILYRNNIQSKIS